MKPKKFLVHLSKMRDKVQQYLKKADEYAKKAARAEGAEARKYKLSQMYYKTIAKLTEGYRRAALTIYRQLMAIKSKIAMLYNRLRGYRGKNLNQKARANLVKKIEQLKSVYKSKEGDLTKLQEDLLNKRHISYRRYQQRLEQIIKEAGLFEKGKAVLKGVSRHGA